MRAVPLGPQKAAAAAIKAQAKFKGEKFYFTGIACKRGHTANRYVISGHCVECAAEHQKIWWAAQPAGAKSAHYKKWASTHQAEVKLYKKTLCPKCNLSKGDKLPTEFAKKHGMLL